RRWIVESQQEAVADLETPTPTLNKAWIVMHVFGKPVKSEIPIDDIELGGDMIGHDLVTLADMYPVAIVFDQRFLVLVEHHLHAVAVEMWDIAIGKTKVALVGDLTHGEEPLQKQLR